METLLINKYKPQSFEEMNLDSYLISYRNSIDQIYYLPNLCKASDTFKHSLT